MTILVRTPQPLRGLTGDLATVDGSGSTLRECITNLETEFPGISERILEEDGELRRFVNVYIDGEDVRFEQGMDTPIDDNSEISIVPAVAGGSQ